VTGWLSSERFVDVFTGSGFARCARVLAIAPVWALFTVAFGSLAVAVDGVIARRRADRHSASTEPRAHSASE
jgi:hypothetical protein